MGDTVGPLVDELLRRVRDISAQGTSRAIARRLLIHAEGLVGIGLRAHVETFTFSATPSRLIYDLASISNRIGEVLTVKAEGRDLNKTAFTDFVAQSVHWFRDEGQFYECWAPLGRDLLVLWPAVTARPVTITVQASAMPQAPDETYVGSDLDTLTVDARWSPYVIDWAEIFLLLRMRKIDNLKGPIERLKYARGAAVAGALV